MPSSRLSCQLVQHTHSFGKVGCTPKQKRWAICIGLAASSQTFMHLTYQTEITHQGSQFQITEMNHYWLNRDQKDAHTQLSVDFWITRRGWPFVHNSATWNKKWTDKETVFASARVSTYSITAIGTNGSGAKFSNISFLLQNESLSVSCVINSPFKNQCRWIQLTKFRAFTQTLVSNKAISIWHFQFLYIIELISP